LTLYTSEAHCESFMEKIGELTAVVDAIPVWTYLCL